ncbi:hypothetical protein TDB9533_01762 [Thalassocella blandensis]|nr:hypothetical protein TDB9533_01762 [Thalassocella blandensis]
MHLHESQIGCPYCGELLTLLIDPSVETQQYVEDCHVCCAPMLVSVSVDLDDDEQHIYVDVQQEN